jgi:hypothetical protein
MENMHIARESSKYILNLFWYIKSA